MAHRELPYDLATFIRNSTIDTCIDLVDRAKSTDEAITWLSELRNTPIVRNRTA